MSLPDRLRMVYLRPRAVPVAGAGAVDGNTATAGMMGASTEARPATMCGGVVMGAPG